MAQSVLLIDPRQQHRQVIREYIDRTHPELQLVEKEPSSFEQVTASVCWSEYDLLLIDNQLGNEDGLQWVRRFKADRDFPPVIFISSANAESTGANLQVQAGLQLGACDFLFKEQIDSEVLSRCLSKALSIRKGRLKPATLSSPSANDEYRPAPAALKNTYHEVRHARALLHGQDHWPFSVQDLQAGEARLAGYIVQEYQGQTGGYYIFKGQSITGQQPYLLKLVDLSSLQVGHLNGHLRDLLDPVMGWSHPHVVSWADYQLIDNHLLIVQPVVCGDSLACRMRKTGVTPAQAVTYFRQLMQALSYLHSQGLQAGPLSPGQLYLKSHEELVLTHFDYAGLLPGENLPIHAFGIRGDAQYCSPEQFQGKVCDHRSDLYVAGVILYSMMSGRPPYGQGSTQTLLSANVATPAPLLRDRKHPLNAIVQGLMEKAPEHRMQSADEALHRLDDLIRRGKVASL